MKIPDPLHDRAFLYNDWRPDRPTLVAFIDPLCPYCKKAIPKFDQVTDYNLFVYWAPIFGQRSEEAIKPFFRCEHPAGRAILTSLIAVPGTATASVAVACEGDSSSANDGDLRRAVNDEMVASYPINGVPAFFLQGVSISLSQIETAHVESARYVNGVAIDWPRYKESRIEQNSPGGNLAIILPEHQDPEASLRLAMQYRPEYFFSAGEWKPFCQELSATACATGEGVQRARLQQYLEIAALLGVDTRSGEAFLLSRDGRLRSISADALSTGD